jgi:prevent-host-death family protein
VEETWTITAARARFSTVIDKAIQGVTIIITRAGRPVVKIQQIKPVRRKPGTGRGAWMPPDFDDPLEDFADYM